MCCLVEKAKELALLGAVEVAHLMVRVILASILIGPPAALILLAWRFLAR